MSINKNIIDQFELLLKQIKLDIDYTSGKQQMINMYRLRSTQEVIKILKKYSQKITSSSQLQNIKNIGKKSLARIDEILKTGKLSEIKISPYVNDYLHIIDELEKIFGIGRKKAFELFKEHNITSIDDLKQKYKSGNIDLPPNIVKGLEYVGKIKENIPRSEIDKLSVILSNTSMTIDPQLFCTICGSYRRQNKTSGDVDVILVHPTVQTQKDLKKINYIQLFVSSLKQQHIIIDSLTNEDVNTKYMGIYKIDNSPLRRIDIRYVPYESFYSAILYFTGSKNFNTKMRQLAIDLGYTLNEYGLYDEYGKIIKSQSEKDIFDALGMEYLTPDKRI